MRRRDVLVGAAAGVPFALASPAIAQGVRRLTMVTDWPEGPGMLASARRLAHTISKISNGRIEIEVSASGAVVRPFETFDAVEAGVADMFHSHIGYFEQKSPAFHFYSGVPFGLTTNELFAWVHHGGGQALFDELAAGFGIKPLLCCSPGAQMGGWFVREVRSKEDFRGLRYRMAGLGAEVYRRLGATVVLLPAAEIVPSLQSGAIDACEWVGPWLDMEIGLHEVASYYYYPGWHEPGAALTLGIRTQAWESLSPGDQRLIETASAAEFGLSLAEFNTNNASALQRIRNKGAVTLAKFDDGLLKAFADISKEVIVEIGSGDDLSSRIFDSHLAFRDAVRKWTEVSDVAYLGVSPLK
jgi:TRAP-type mannitol/chloroaromatic compound transport system substrate-binding protein